MSGNAKTPYEADEHLHFELRTQEDNMKGLFSDKRIFLIILVSVLHADAN